MRRSAEDRARVLAALQSSADANGGTPRWYVVAEQTLVAAETCKRWWYLAKKAKAAEAAAPREGVHDPRALSALDFALLEFADLDECIGTAKEDRSFGALPGLIKLRRESFDRVQAEVQAVSGKRKMTTAELAELLRRAAATMPVGLAQEVIAVLRERGIAA